MPKLLKWFGSLSDLIFCTISPKSHKMIFPPSITMQYVKWVYVQTNVQTELNLHILESFRGASSRV